ncbi:Uncharacterised protein [Pseudomonas aeruginosa]|nr:Uncharacterised protein [Pseudomonas aeruginosa]CAC9177140.1 Uncharacterised protein [Pseudomonas aeruginosa]
MSVDRYWVKILNPDNDLRRSLAFGGRPWKVEVERVVGTTASFPYIVEPVLRTQQAGGFTAEVNPGVTELSERVDVKMTGRALDIMPQVVSHIYR